MRRSSESPGSGLHRRGRGRAQANVGPTSERQRRPAAKVFAPAQATSPATGLCHWKNRRSSRGPPFRPAARPLPQTQGTRRQTPTQAEGRLMVANALLFTIAILLAYGFWLLDQLKFMARYKAVVFHAYGAWILGFGVVLFVNLFGLAVTVSRRFLLKN